MVNAIRNSVRNLVQKRGARLRQATPAAITISLAAAALAPVILGDFQLSAPTLQSIFGLVSGLGQNVLYEFIEFFRDKLKAKGETPDEEEVQAELEQGLMAKWHADGAEGELIRQDISHLLQSTHSLDAALAAASTELRQSLAQGLAELGSDFKEFRWMLDDLRQILADIRLQQAQQLALQREQMDLQRRQLVKTDLLLQIHQQRAALPGHGDGVQEDDEQNGAPADVPCPYKGLAPFQPEDAEYFFGREELLAQMTAHLAISPLIAVVGPSGSGKSSVVRAGLLPSLWRNALPGSQDWPTLLMTPGPHPMEELAVRLAALMKLPPATLLRDLETEPKGLELAVQALLMKPPSGSRFVLVVDQFEEIFVSCRLEEERRRFIATLLRAVAGGRILIAITLRADYYGQCMYYPELSKALEENDVLVGPLNEDELRRAIERPASHVGLKLQPELVETLIREVAGEPGTLPLLSHVLMETWNRRRGRTLTMSGYLEAGGVSGAVARSADAVYSGFSPSQQAIARNIFLRLTEVGESSAQDARRRASRTELISRPELAASVDTVLQALAGSRLITIGEQTVEVAHEALIRRWPTLRNWLNQNRDQLQIYHRLVEDAREWAQLNRDAGALYRGARLALSREFAASRGDELNDLEREFLAASMAQQTDELDRERRRTEQMRRRSVGLAGALSLACLMIVAAVILGISAYRQRNEARQQGRLTLAGKLAAQSLVRLNDQLDLALLLSVEAHRINSSVDTRRSLLTAVNHNPQIVHFLAGHTQSVSGLAFSPDRRVLASASYDGTVRRWDAITGRSLGPPMRGHDGLVCTVAFSPTGGLLASGGQDGSICLWNPVTGAQVGKLPTGHTSAVWGLAFSPDGKTLASASGDQTIRLWDPVGRRPIGAPLAGHTDEVVCLAFSPDGGTLASGGNDRTLRLWSASDGRPIGKPLTGHTHSVWTVAFSPDGKMLASGSADYSIRLWRIPQGTPAGAPLQGHTGSVFALAFSPNGRALLSLGGDHTLRIWDTATGSPMGEPQKGCPGFIMAATFSPDISFVAGGGQDGGIVILDLKNRIITGRTLFGHDRGVADITYADEGRFLISIGEDSVIRRWSPLGEQPEKSVSCCKGAAPIFAALSPDGRFAATTGLDSVVRLWDTSSGEALLPPLAGHTQPVSCLVFSPDSGLLASGSDDGTICLWDRATGRLRGPPLTGHKRGITCLAFRPDGGVLASGGSDGTIRTWDVKSGKPLAPWIYAHSPAVSSLAFSPDGKLIASGGMDSLLGLWNATDLRAIGRPLQGHGDTIFRLAFSVDGSMLVSASLDKTLRLWDAATGQPLSPLLSIFDKPVTAITPSPDGRSLAVGDASGMILHLDLNLASWEAQACRRAGRNLSLLEWTEFMGDQPYRQTWPEWPPGNGAGKEKNR